ncbi:hypothetical protein D9615_010642 [Tricholomella constricta]|uniref:Uncharacterized protein n=1 Tax=Tricholomella constricta TaxID=117010 RepID=A0A8H5GIS6_9AGAR|nr:hypothetical protein D9615_010700 [Tricholomella constricta]KAF5366680.1 hypothetical protein D9615_010642 [Tricholomella constricta]
MLQCTILNTYKCCPARVRARAPNQPFRYSDVLRAIPGIDTSFASTAPHRHAHLYRHHNCAHHRDTLPPTAAPVLLARPRPCTRPTPTMEAPILAHELALLTIGSHAQDGAYSSYEDVPLGIPHPLNTPASLPPPTPPRQHQQQHEWPMGLGEGMRPRETERERRRERRRMLRIKADLMAEVAAISVLHSDFPVAQHALDALVTHTRTHSVFEVYTTRLPLLHAQPAHARVEEAKATHLTHRRLLPLRRRPPLAPLLPTTPKALALQVQYRNVHHISFWRSPSHGTRCGRSGRLRGRRHEVERSWWSQEAVRRADRCWGKRQHPPLTFSSPPKSSKPAILVTISIRDYDLSDTSKLLHAAYMGITMMAFIHPHLKYALPFFIQVLMGLKNLYDAKLVSIHLGKPAEANFKRPCKTAGMFGAAPTGPATDAAAIVEAVLLFPLHRHCHAPQVQISYPHHLRSRRSSSSHSHYLDRDRDQLSKSRLLHDARHSHRQQHPTPSSNPSLRLLPPYAHLRAPELPLLAQQDLHPRRPRTPARYRPHLALIPGSFEPRQVQSVEGPTGVFGAAGHDGVGPGAIEAIRAVGKVRCVCGVRGAREEVA